MKSLVTRLVGPLTAIVVTGGCVAQPGLVPSPAPSASRSRVDGRVLRIQVRDGGRLVVRDVPIEDYVTVAILSEFDPPAADPAAVERMFEVQAIIARTYAVSNGARHAADGFDLCSSTHCQLYEPARLRTSRWAPAAEDAVRRTAGETLDYAGAPARALFHADCGGHTSSAAAVWGGEAAPYLMPEPDSVGADVHASWTFEATREQLRTALNADPRTAVGARLERIEVAEQDGAGRAEKVTLRGTLTFLVRGEVLREVMTRTFGAKSLRSTLMTVSRQGDRLIFAGKGFGHGVGLCQAGAFARIRSGETPSQVLRHYFPGTTVVR